MRVATFEDLRPKVYQFEVIAPDGESFLIEMRTPTPSELLTWEREFGNPPEAPVTDIKRHPDGTFEEIRDMQPVIDWQQDRILKQVLKLWTAEVPGETDADQIDHMNELGAWAVNALVKCFGLLIRTPDEALKTRPFRGNGAPPTANL